MDEQSNKTGIATVYSDNIPNLIVFYRETYCFSLSICLSYCPSQIMSNLVNATPPIVLAGSFRNPAGIFDQGLKMCMTFGCNSQIHFCYFFSSLNLVIFQLIFYKSIFKLGIL